MSKQKSPYTTPKGFFEEQQKAIWKEASSLTTEHELERSGGFGRYAWAAGIAATLAIGLFLALPDTAEHCETFACLWEETPIQSLPLDDAEIESWLEDDVLFETVFNETTDV